MIPVLSLLFVLSPTGMILSTGSTFKTLCGDWCSTLKSKLPGSIEKMCACWPSDSLSALGVVSCVRYVVSEQQNKIE